MMQPILTIGITSYNRVNELIRCVTSIQTNYCEDIEIIVSEDCSPMSSEIGEAVKKLKAESKYDIKFMPNEHNLGYDGNLGAIIQKSQGEYVFLISDDDAMYDGFLDILIPFLKNPENKSYGVLYAAIADQYNGRKNRNHQVDMIIPKGEESAIKYVYDPILFSGLVFKKDYVKDIDAKSFLNMNYIQVYYFLKMIHHYGGYYFAYPSVCMVGDGENAYGIAESSGGNEKIADRTKVVSNIEFHRTLIQVIKRFDSEEGTHVIAAFENQYSLRSYMQMAIARKESVATLKEFWSGMKSLDIHIKPIAYVYYYSLLILGTKICNGLTYYARRKTKHDDKI